MRRSSTGTVRATVTALCLWAAMWPACMTVPADAQQVVDRIVAKIEDDVILLSEVHELAAYQQLVEGRAEPNAKLVNELIEQWIVNNEAMEARYPRPSEADIDREVAKVENKLPSPEAYNQRLAELGIAPQTVRRIVGQQIYLARYLDYKFRPIVRVDDAAIAAYYKEKLTPQLETQHQPVPPLADVMEKIRELLIQQGIDARVATWFDETKSRMKIEIEPEHDAADPVPAASTGSSDKTGMMKRDEHGQTSMARRTWVDTRLPSNS
jgi:hypothetical protein